MIDANALGGLGSGRRQRCGRLGPLRRGLQTLLSLTLTLGLALALLCVVAAPAEAVTTKTALLERQAQWPAWSLPAPLPRPGRNDLLLPDWMLGSWQLLELNDAEPDAAASARPAPPTPPQPIQTPASAPAGPEASHEASEEAEAVTVRFRADRRGRVVGDRAFNALNLGRSVLGDRLLGVEDDPSNPNRQLARLRGERLLESTVIGRSSLGLDGDTFLADELTLEILHGPGQPQISQVEVLALYRREGEGVSVEQWQASYAGPGGSSEGRHSSHRLLQLQRLPAPPRTEEA